jgi:hypothetical protein
MKRASFALALIVPLLFGACDDPIFPGTDDVFLDVDASQYAPGDTAILRIQNESGTTIGYNLCVHLVQRRINDRWEDTLYGHDLPCVGIQYELEDDESDTFPAPLDADTPAGTYRIRTRIDTDFDGEFSIYTESFDVE